MYLHTFNKLWNKKMGELHYQYEEMQRAYLPHMKSELLNFECNRSQGLALEGKKYSEPSTYTYRYWVYIYSFRNKPKWNDLKPFTLIGVITILHFSALMEFPNFNNKQRQIQY